MIYQDLITIYKVVSGGYGGKIIEEYEEVSAIFLQGVGFTRTNNQEMITSDAVCYVDPLNSFVVAENNRLEGMYILAPLFDVSDEQGWYRVTNCIVNRDHLLGNTIDNIQLLLKKTNRLINIS